MAGLYQWTRPKERPVLMADCHYEAVEKFRKLFDHVYGYDVRHVTSEEVAQQHADEMIKKLESMDDYEIEP